MRSKPAFHFQSQVAYLAFDAIEALVDGIEAPVDLGKALVDGIETLVNRVETLFQSLDGPTFRHRLHHARP